MLKKSLAYPKCECVILWTAGLGLVNFTSVDLFDFSVFCVKIEICDWFWHWRKSWWFTKILQIPHLGTMSICSRLNKDLSVIELRCLTSVMFWPRCYWKLSLCCFVWPVMHLQSCWSRATWKEALSDWRESTCPSTTYWPGSASTTISLVYKHTRPFTICFKWHTSILKPVGLYYLHLNVS